MMGGVDPEESLSVDVLFDGVTSLDELDAWQNFAIEQIDDYYGVPNEDGQGDDVAVWFFPLRDCEVIEHSSELPDGVRLSFNVLRNRADRVGLFLDCLSAFAEQGRVVYDGEPIAPPFEPLRRDLSTVLSYWRSKGIEVGTDAALLI